MNNLSIVAVLLPEKLLKNLCRLIHTSSGETIQSGQDINAAVAVFIELNHFCIFNSIIQLINKEITQFLTQTKRFFRIHVEESM